MKKIITSIVILVLIMASINTVYADTTTSIKSIDEVIDEIRMALALKSTDLINPDNVNNDLLNLLGDSVMEAMIGNHELHELMDERMGGYGSESLTSMHINIGYDYLYRILNGSWNSNTRYPSWGMTNGLSNNSMMMRNSNWSYRMWNQNWNQYWNQYWNANMDYNPIQSGVNTNNQLYTNTVGIKSWGSQAPCCNINYGVSN